ncbi:interferon alpha/beta receptor 2-like isoform 2-T2 [Acanthopagrus schlegelii]
MRLWILLLLLLRQSHLGNAPWTEAISVSLPAPSNVSISSINMEHTLSFLPGADSPDSSRFEVQVVRVSKRSWTAVAACSALKAGQTCNLTQVFKKPLEQYRARVRAFTAGQTSSWTVSAAFQPLSDTVLGPPDVVVSGCGNCLLLQVRPPSSVGMLPTDLYMDLVLNVKRTRDGAQFILTRPYKEEMEISYLQRGVEYCVTVTVKTLFNDNSVPSDAHCAFTSPPPSHSLSVVYGLLGAFCALLLLLIGSITCNGQLSVRLLRRRLPTSLSYFLLKVQDVGAAPPELSGDTSDMPLHKEGSADCLLPDH